LCTNFRGLSTFDYVSGDSTYLGSSHPPNLADSTGYKSLSADYFIDPKPRGG